MILKRFLLLVSIALVTASGTSAQRNETFTSYIGGFVIGIDKRPDGLDGIGSGIRYTWRLPSAKYEIGFHELEGLPLAVENGEFSYDAAVNRYFNRFSTFGERIYVRDSSIEQHPAKDFRYKLKGSIFLLRLSRVHDRVYQLQAELPTDSESSMAEVIRIFGSIRLVDKESVARHFAEEIKAATPSALPQAPKTTQLTTDLQDRNLRGRVKTILTEAAHYALNSSLKQRKRKLLEEFDKSGNLLRQIEYDSHGAPSSVRVFGYVAGKRVARLGSLPGEYSLGGMGMDLPLSRKADIRFDESIVQRYGAGKLLERRGFLSNGALISRTTYRYVGRSRETRFFDGGSQPFGKEVALLDDKGNEIRLTYFEREGGTLLEKETFDIRYDSFDAIGNWTNRLTSHRNGSEGSASTFPESVEYRTISYHTAAPL